MTELASSGPDLIEVLRPFLTPGAIVVVGTVLTVGHKIWPMAKGVVEFIRGDETKHEKELQRDIDESRAELARLDKNREDQMEGLREDIDRKNEELQEARREMQRVRAESQRSRDEADFERRSGIRYYQIGVKSYQMLLQARHDWRNGKPPPLDDLIEFESLVATPRPEPPRSRPRQQGRLE